MTRAEKKEKRKKRAFLRKAKRIAKDLTYIKTADNYNRYSISWGRRKLQGRIFSCEMGCLSCEERGYCNGDC
jgi:hypothetical protein